MPPIPRGTGGIQGEGSDEYDAVPGQPLSPCRKIAAVNTRRIPGAILLGLLASLVAHAAAFGDGHAVGGAFHESLATAALAAGVGLFVGFGALAWIGAGRHAEGSVLASRLEARLPRPVGLTAASTVWLSVGEMLEGPHLGAPALTLALSVAAAAALVYVLAVGIVRLLAGIAIAIRATTFAPRVPFRTRRAYVLIVAAPSGHAGRRFARPPPR